ncbi:MAG TPA: cyclic nucleotide-binding and patatin-like phospholipase domain-containing protein [Acidimicrobiia bacterium]|nr:cyclic nucleotide-binding and patatin-like phospholipase domain-containing protein [Acidimicrobiia bacterium]
MTVARDGGPVPRDAIERLIEEGSIFRGLDPSARGLLAKQFEPQAIPGGAVLMRQGDPADALFLVSVGRFRVSIERDDGTETVVAELGRGDIVGELALITDDPRSATVTAVRDSQVLRLDTTAFTQLVSTNPAIQREFTTEVIRRLVRSFREGSPTSPVATIAVVPLDHGPGVIGMSERLHQSLDRLAGPAGHVTKAATAAAVGTLEEVGPDRLAAWFAEHESGFEVVAYQGSAEPGSWTDACIRQADLVLVVASADGSPAVRDIERSIAERRRLLKSRVELVLVHPASTQDPRETRRFLAGRDVDRHHHVRVDRDADVDRVARLILGRGIGVVFSGGGARGIAGIGVYQALLEAGVPIDATGGTSIGSLLAGGAARGQTADEIAAQIRAAVLDSSPFDVTFPVVSLARGRRVTQSIRDGAEGLDLEDGWRHVYCVSTNLTTGHEVVHRSGPGWFAIRASFSIPGVFPPVRTENGDLLVDGGMLDNMPVGVMRDEHEGISVIAIDVGKTRDVVAGALPDDGVVSGWKLLRNRMRRKKHRTSAAGLGRILMRLTELGSEQDADHGDLYIRPDIDDYSIADFKAFDRLIELGYEAGQRDVAAWLASGDAPKF